MGGDFQGAVIGGCNEVGRDAEASRRPFICHRVTTLSHKARGADYEASPPGKSAAGAAAVTIFGGPSHSAHSISPYHRHLATKTAPSPRQSRQTSLLRRDAGAW